MLAATGGVVEIIVFSARIARCLASSKSCGFIGITIVFMAGRSPFTARDVTSILSALLC